MTFKKSLVFILTLVVVMTLAACGGKNNANNSSSNESPAASADNGAAAATGKLADIKKAGKIVLGTSAEYAPYEFHKNVDGKDQIVGFDIEIAKEVAKDLGVDLEIKDMDFGNLLAELKLGKIDFVIAGMTPDEERSKAVDFSKIYYEAKQGVLVRAEDKDNFTTMADLEGKAIGVQMGSTQEKIAQGIKGAKLKSLGKTTDLVLELKSKKVDALIVELPVAQGYANVNSDLALTSISPEYESGGSAVAVNKGEKDLLAEIQKTLDHLTADKKIDQWVSEMTQISEQ
ncbi:amino acid ABC transporter substrate-binding protein (PAAT family) [Paenibacillus sp. BK033]|uniref:ABC transporter substrate-binding protein n=1 Tax=Paenibacillus sp. BK033 TaxID=2512133 RepID=UPI00104877C0|nr:ABC transporter substrate-binding protein [Paenibacillus sp. BK033]TCM87949.1 amino acid ABC transporter substrate-binding protein (PAAT family) [Paenibacillus sp. BK033]